MSEYEKHLIRRGLAPKTVTFKLQTIGSLHKWIQRCPSTATTDDIEAWLDSRRICAATRYRYVSHLHTFYQWTIAWGHATSDPTLRVIRPKVPRYLPRPISEADLGMAVAMASPQIGCWLLLGAYAGLRCFEIAALESNDIDFTARLIRVRGKGSKDRLIPMHDVLAEKLDALGVRRGPVFLRDDGTPWPAQKVSYHGALHMRSIGIDCTMHQLRHRFATQTYAACQDLRAVQEMMGHASPTTTAVYTAWSPTVGRAAVDALPV